jgi:hypothetical protein
VKDKKHIDFNQLQDAVKLFGLIGLETKNDIKQKYLKLSKTYHPDSQTGDTVKFQELNKAYKLLIKYIENFKFTFSQEEYQNQYPFSMKKNGQWSLW